ncbi:MAG TPA: ABC transporter permease, partial [Blastocatellia bacterium]
MKWLNIVLRTLRVLFRRDAVVEDVDEELRFHFELERQRHIERGLNPDDAFKAALKTFGSPVRMRDLGLDYRGGSVMDAFYRDVKHGFRMLLKTPSSTFIAVFTLALGVGATAGVFSLIQGVLLTPPPYQHPDRLALIQTARTDGMEKGRTESSTQDLAWTPSQLEEWQRESKSLDGVAGYSWTFNFLVLRDGSRSMEGMVVTKDYFQVLGLEPLLGHLLPDVFSDKAPAIVLGYDFWQQQFNGDPNIIGRTIEISRWDNLPTVIGVMRPGVRFLPSNGSSQEPNYNVNAKIDFWAPIIPDPSPTNGMTWDVVARLKNGISTGEAQAELAVVVRHEAETDNKYQGIAPKVI